MSRLRGSVSSLLHCGMAVRRSASRVSASEGASAPSSIAARHVPCIEKGRHLELRGSVSSLLHCGPESCGRPTRIVRSEGASAPSSIAAGTPGRMKGWILPAAPRERQLPPPLRRALRSLTASPSMPRLRGSVSSLLHCGKWVWSPGGGAGSLRGSVSSLLHCGPTTPLPDRRSCGEPPRERQLPPPLRR